MAARERKILAMLEPSLLDMGYELIEVEYHSAPGGGTLRLYIDAANGIDIEDCEAVSRQASALLDVEDPIAGQYNLEVSSPGVDRVLRTAEHFATFLGEQADVRLRRPLDGRRKFTGVITAVDEDITLTVDGQSVQVAVDQIERARLVPDYAELMAGAGRAGASGDVN
ncbi:MAG: ribosome maturation factor RimP [Pseudomonadota bacterium]